MNGEVAREATYPPEGRQAFERLQLAEAVRNHLKGMEQFTQSEIAHMKAERLRVLAFDEAVAADQERLSDALNRQALGYQRQALAEIATARTSWDAALVEELNARAQTPEFRQAVDDAKEAFLRHLSEQDLAPEDAREIAPLWDRAAEIATTRGLTGLVDRWEEDTKRLIEVRSEEGRGRQEASPLPFWMVVCIGVVLVIDLGAVLGCFFWSNCSWIWVWLGVSAVACFCCCTYGTCGIVF